MHWHFYPSFKCLLSHLYLLPPHHHNCSLSKRYATTIPVIPPYAGADAWNDHHEHQWKEKRIKQSNDNRQLYNHHLHCFDLQLQPLWRTQNADLFVAISPFLVLQLPWEKCSTPQSYLNWRVRWRESWTKAHTHLITSAGRQPWLVLCKSTPNKLIFKTTKVPNRPLNLIFFSSDFSFSF